jgi:hypothetical protein
VLIDLPCAPVHRVQDTGRKYMWEQPLFGTHRHSLRPYPGKMGAINLKEESTGPTCLPVVWTKGTINYIEHSISLPSSSLAHRHRLYLGPVFHLDSVAHRTTNHAPMARPTRLDVVARIPRRLCAAVWFISPSKGAFSLWRIRWADDI